MNENYYYEDEIDLKDMLIYFLKKWRVIFFWSTDWFSYRYYILFIQDE